MRKSLISLTLTTAIFILFRVAVFADDSALFNDDSNLLINMKKSPCGISQSFYWKSPVETPLNFNPLKKQIDMVDYFNKYKCNFNLKNIKTSLKIREFISIYADRKILKEQWVSLSTNLVEDAPIEGFFMAGKNSETADTLPVILGLKAQKNIFDAVFTSKLDYVCDLNNIPSTGRVNFHLKSNYEIGDRWNSNLEVAFSIFGKSKSNSIEKQASIYPAYEKNSDEIIAEDLSVAKAKLKLHPFKNMKLSLNYSYYTKQLKRYSFSYDNPVNIFSGYNNCKRELNFTADFFNGSNISSSLLAGWYKPGKEYAESPGDDSVFEIRGEIVVSF